MRISSLHVPVPKKHDIYVYVIYLMTVQYGMAVMDGISVTSSVGTCRFVKGGEIPLHPGLYSLLTQCDSAGGEMAAFISDSTFFL